MKRACRGSGAGFGSSLAVLLALAAGPAHAAVLTASVTLPTCDGGALKNCADTGALNTTLVGATSAFLGSPSVDGALATFATAFDAWNAANGNAWSLVDGGPLSGVSIDATVGVSASDGFAGLAPVLFTLSGASNALLSQLVWTQALVIDYTPLQGALAQPIQTLDTFGLSQDAQDSNRSFPATCTAPSSGASPAKGAFCGPIYPFQYGSEYSKDYLNYSATYGYYIDRGSGLPLGSDFFFDAPQGSWPDASFEAITLLSEVDASTDTLTVYQGVEYGFTLAAPEPATWALALVGFAAAGLAGYGARRKALSV